VVNPVFLKGLLGAMITRTDADVKDLAILAKNFKSLVLDQQLRLKEWGRFCYDVDAQIGCA